MSKVMLNYIEHPKQPLFTYWDNAEVSFQSSVCVYCDNGPGHFIETDYASHTHAEFQIDHEGTPWIVPGENMDRH